nr:glycosyltransferase family 2 protein [Rhizobium sp. Q54]
MKTISVLLSVYNGASFIVPQVESILAQVGVDVRLVIRDDGSTDGTLEAVKSFANESNIRLVSGQNRGIRDSFLSMIADCPFDTDYYAFSDADDIWLPEKLKRAVDLLEAAGADEPAVYSSRLRFVDQDLNDIGFGTQLLKPMSFENAIVECRVSGATAVFNRSARAILSRLDFSRAVMHDAWVYLVVTAFGGAVFDDQSFILYRQHGGNAVGGRPSRIIRWKRRLDRIFGRGLPYYEQAKSLLDQVGPELSPHKRCVLERYVEHRRSFFERLAFALRPSVTFQQERSDRLFRIMVLLGRS